MSRVGPVTEIHDEEIFHTDRRDILVTERHTYAHTQTEFQTI